MQTKINISPSARSLSTLHFAPTITNPTGGDLS